MKVDSRGSPVRPREGLHAVMAGATGGSVRGTRWVPSVWRGEEEDMAPPTKIHLLAAVQTAGCVWLWRCGPDLEALGKQGPATPPALLLSPAGRQSPVG